MSFERDVSHMLPTTPKRREPVPIRNSYAPLRVSCSKRGCQRKLTNSDRANDLGLRPLGGLANLELHALTLVEAFEAI